ncbi:Hydroxymethylglutaryl-CoA lyase, mitochondrial [Hordeum vulgare]|nr:Hydroxymethylglutaryl-CoA lyase, mitochondrial [Hordeum vulgare]
MMENGSDDAVLAPAPPVDSCYNMKQVLAHYNAAIAEGKPILAPTLTLVLALEEHGLALRQIDGERMSKVALAAMAMANLNFIAEQHAIYDAISAQAVTRQEVATAEENNDSCASYTPPMNHHASRWDNDSQGSTISLANLTSTPLVTISFEDQYGKIPCMA